MLAYELDETLIRIDQQGKIVPGLASHWTLDREKNEYTFSLSDECAWSDGTKIKAQDVVLGLRHLYKFGKPSIPGWRVIEGAREIMEEDKSIHRLGVEAVDDNTVRVKVVGDPEFALKSLTYSAFSPLPSHATNQQQKWQLSSPVRVTSGPYRIHSANRNEIVAVKNHHYCKSRHPKIDQIRIFNNTEDYVPIREFIAGNIDFIRDISSKQLEGMFDAFPTNKRPNFTSEPTYRQVYLVLNSELNGLQDIEIRAALWDALDFSNLLESRGSIDHFFEKSNSIFYDLPHYENVEYNSRSIPYEAGLKNLREIMERKGYSAKKPMKLEMKTWPLPRFVTVSKLISSMLKPAHFDLKFTPSASTSNAYNDVINGEYDMFVGSWVLDYLDTQNSWEGLLQIYLNAVRSSAELENFGLPKDFRQRVNKLNSKLVNARFTAERYATLQALETELSKAHIVLPLYTEKTGILYAKELNLDNHFNQYTRSSYWETCGSAK